MYVVVCRADTTDSEIGRLHYACRAHGGYFFHERRAYFRDPRHLHYNRRQREWEQSFGGYNAVTFDVYLPKGTSIPKFLAPLTPPDEESFVRALWLRSEWSDD